MGILLRLVGAAITVLAALGYSAVKSREARMRIEKCKAVYRFLCECRLRIECHSLPIGDILERCSGLLTAEFVECAKREGLAVAADKWKDKLLDGDEERAVFADFTQSFGRGHTDMEAKRCADCIDRLKKHTEMLENAAKTENKTRLAVSLSVSVMAVLFFA